MHPPTTRQCAPGRGGAKEETGGEGRGGEGRGEQREGRGGAGSGGARPFQLSRAAVPLGTDSEAEPRSRPWRGPGLGHSGTRSSPGAPAPGLRLSCGRRSWVPAEAWPPPSSRLQSPGSRPSPRRFPPTRPAGPQTTPSLPADAAPPPRGFRQLSPAAVQPFSDVQPPQALAPDARPPRPTAPALTRSPRVSQPQLPRPPSRPAADPVPPPFDPGGNSLPPPRSRQKAATCLRRRWESLSTSAGAPRPPRRRQGPRGIPRADTGRPFPQLRAIWPSTEQPPSGGPQLAVSVLQDSIQTPYDEQPSCCFSGHQPLERLRAALSYPGSHS